MLSLGKSTLIPRQIWNGCLKSTKI